MMRNPLQSWLRPPTFADEDKTLLARVLYRILLVLSVADSIAFAFYVSVGQTGVPQILTLTWIPLLAAVWLTRRGHLRAASFVLMLDMLGATVALLLRGDGLQDIAILLFPAIIVAASLLLNTSMFLVIVAMTSLALGWVTLGQLNGQVKSFGQSPSEVLSNLLIALLILWVMAFIVQLLTNNMRQNLRQARLNEQALAASEAQYRRLNEELEAKNSELERFTYTVSHDLKSPLITITGYLGFVEKDAQEQNFDRLQQDLQRIHEAAEKMRRLLAELLELSRIGRVMNPPSEVAFEVLAREAVELVQGRLTARGVQVEIAAGLPTVYGDRARLVEVVQNLVDNAAKFMGDQPQPRIVIGMRPERLNDWPVFFVQDNGSGIDPRYHAKVFGLFDKLDARSEGTGVGLALAKRIVEVHGGRIWLESGGQGQGSTFCFTLPTQNSAAY